MQQLFHDFKNLLSHERGLLITTTNTQGPLIEVASYLESLESIIMIIGRSNMNRLQKYKHGEDIIGVEETSWIHKQIGQYLNLQERVLSRQDKILVDKEGTLVTIES